MHNSELEDRERQREPTYKRGKLLREVCNPPRSAGVVGLTEYYVDRFGAALVFELTDSCCKPRGPLRLYVASAVENVMIARAILELNKKNAIMVMQFLSEQQMWRDCLIRGPCTGLPEHLSLSVRHRMVGEQQNAVYDVPVAQIRFRELDDEEDFFVLLRAMTQGNTQGTEEGK